MWLLSTDRAELHYFTTPEAAKEGYAILSHCWSAKEQSFPEVREIASNTLPGENPRDRMDDKIGRCCELAESHGYKWIWIDTCCIDKSSSAELSESINSMFDYYALSSICYAYLHDSDALRSPQCIATVSFRECRWITRGWTLQELIAPEIVMFVNRRWELLGTKHDLAYELERHTKVPSSLLRMEASIGSFSIAQRMSWASGRETTRVEDQAYSLLGIFHVNMPTLYGEGARAFQRLQEEIMRRSPDTTLFAWGQMIDSEELFCFKAGQSNQEQQYFHNTPHNVDQSYGRNRCYLFAESPRNFAKCAAINHTPSRTMGKSLQWHSHTASYSHRAPTFSLTPHGVLSELPLFLFDQQLLRYADVGWTITRPDALCEDHLLLPLAPMGHAVDGTPTLHYPGIPNVPHFGRFNDDSGPVIYRLVRVTDGEYNKMLQENLQWQTVYLHTQPVGHPYASMSRRTFPGTSLFSPFRVSRPAVQQLIASVPGLSLRGWDDSSSPSPLAFQRSRRPGVMTLEFRLNGEMFFEILLGQCDTPYLEPQHEPRATRDLNRLSHGRLPLSRWATLKKHTIDEISEEPSHCTQYRPEYRHSCTEDHISTWVDGRKTFTCTSYPLRLSSVDPNINARVVRMRVNVTLCFSPCPMNAEGTAVLYCESSVSELTIDDLTISPRT